MKPVQVPISIVRSFVSFHRYLHYVRSRVIKLDEISSAYGIFEDRNQIFSEFTPHLKIKNQLLHTRQRELTILVNHNRSIDRLNIINFLYIDKMMLFIR